MKNIILYIMSTVFITNTLVVSADVKLCMQNDLDVPQIEVSAEADMPCHDEQQNNQQDHCQDVCFCLHYAANQAPIIDADAIHLFLSEDKQLFSSDALLVSRILSVIYRPPIYIS